MGATDSVAGLVKGILDSQILWQSASMFDGVQALVRELLINLFNDDAPLPSLTVAEAMKVLIAQMVADGDTVRGNTVSVTLTPGASNAGNGAIVRSVRRGDGRNTEHAKAETLKLEVTTTGLAGTVTVKGAPRVSASSHEWPGGS